MIRLLLADDQPLVRAGLRAVFEGESDMTIAGEAADGVQAVEAVRQLEIDVVLMDIRMPRLDGAQATAEIVRESSGSCRVIILTGYGQDEHIYRSLKAGASGFLLKNLTAERLVSSVRAVVAGESLLAPEVTRRLIEEFTRRYRPSRLQVERLAELTERQMEVLRLMAKGLSNSEIAATLTVEESTVKTHVTHLLERLDVRDRVQAVVVAYETGLV